MGIAHYHTSCVSVLSCQVVLCFHIVTNCWRVANNLVVAVWHASCDDVNLALVTLAVLGNADGYTHIVTGDLTRLCIVLGVG